MSVGRRVLDRIHGHEGTVVAVRGRGYIVHWDDPTPHQDEAIVRIPARFFDWKQGTDTPNNNPNVQGNSNA